MRTIQLHPTSLLVGAAVVGLAVLTMAQNPQPINPTWSPRNPQPVVLLRDYVQIRAGTPYTVPPNKILMITALGNENGQWTSTLSINGTLRLRMDYFGGNGTPLSLSVQEVPRGLTAYPGDLVECSSSYGSIGTAWGFLADA